MTYTKLRLATILVCLGLAPTAQAADEAFSVQSGSVNVGCEEDGSATAEYNAPDGAQIIEANARWINQSKIKQQATSVTEKSNNRVKATGSIRGLDYDKQFPIPNCPGGGHATLEVYGSIRR